MESQCSFAEYKITDKMWERIRPLLLFILYKTELLGGRSRKYLRSVADAISHRIRTISREKAIPHAWAEPRAMLVLVIASSRSSTTAARVQRSMRENVRKSYCGVSSIATAQSRSSRGRLAKISSACRVDAASIGRPRVSVQPRRKTVLRNSRASSGLNSTSISKGARPSEAIQVTPRSLRLSFPVDSMCKQRIPSDHQCLMSFGPAWSAPQMNPSTSCSISRSCISPLGNSLSGKSTSTTECVVGRGCGLLCQCRRA